MASSDPIGAYARRARRARTLPEEAACAFCGEVDVLVLGPRGVSRRLLERHHVAGRLNDPDTTVVLCLNCHAKVSADQTDAGVFDPGGQSVLDRLRRAILSEAAYLGRLVEARLLLAELLGRLEDSVELVAQVEEIQ